MTLNLAEPRHPLAGDDGTRSPPASRPGIPGTQPGSAREPARGRAGTLTAARPVAAATLLSCGGCQACSRYGQDEHRYGMLVYAFLARHEQCASAVTITRVRHGR